MDYYCQCLSALIEMPSQNIPQHSMVNRMGWTTVQVELEDLGHFPSDELSHACTKQRVCTLPSCIEQNARYLCTSTYPAEGLHFR